MKVLVVVDMQNDFISGSLGTPEARAIIPAVVDRIKRHNGVVVITQDTHDETYAETQEGKNLPVSHCVYGTDGWYVHQEVAAAANNSNNELAIFSKPTFGSLELGDYLSALNKSDPVDEIILIGLCTDICVISNAMILKAYLPEVKITVDASCCAGVTPESHANALAAMKMCQINIENE